MARARMTAKQPKLDAITLELEEEVARVEDGTHVPGMSIEAMFAIRSAVTSGNDPFEIVVWTLRRLDQAGLLKAE